MKCRNTLLIYLPPSNVGCGYDSDGDALRRLAFRDQHAIDNFPEFFLANEAPLFNAFLFDTAQHFGDRAIVGVLDPHLLQMIRYGGLAALLPKYNVAAAAG